ncbi:hypothetical protein K438DRAFT_1858652, partial [Mycena galopus ATCC 62051]
ILSFGRRHRRLHKSQISRVRRADHTIRRPSVAAVDGAARSFTQSGTIHGHLGGDSLLSELARRDPGPPSLSCLDSVGLCSRRLLRSGISQ